MPISLLNVFDFDGTITIDLSFKDGMTPENNTKENIRALLVHDDQTLCAIASYNWDIDRVADYLFYIFAGELTRGNKTEYWQGDVLVHTVTEFYLTGNPNPICVSTLPERILPDKSAYKTSRCIVNPSGKNIQIGDIKQHLDLPEDQALCFYDDDRDNAMHASRLPNARSFWVTKGSPTFIKQEVFACDKANGFFDPPKSSHPQSRATNTSLFQPG